MTRCYCCEKDLLGAVPILHGYILCFPCRDKIKNIPEQWNNLTEAKGFQEAYKALIYFVMVNNLPSNCLDSITHMLASYFDTSRQFMKIMQEKE